MEITIKQARSEDAERIAPLFNDYRVFYQQPSDLELAKEFIFERLNSEESVVFYAVNSDGQCLGFTQLYPMFSSVSAQRTWVLNDLFIKDDFRRLGIARLLMDTAKNFAQATGAKGISLATGDDNLSAQTLYHALGYQKEQGFQHYFLTL